MKIRRNTSSKERSLRKRFHTREFGMEPHFKRTLVRIGAGSALALILVWLMTALPSVTTLMMMSFFLAYIFNPPLNRLQSLGMGRSMAALVILFTVATVLSLLFLFFVPAIIRELATFVDIAPAYFDTLAQRSWDFAEKLNLPLPQDWNSAMNMILEKARQVAPKMADVAGNVVSKVFRSTLRFLSFAFYVLLTPVLTYYLMVSFESIKETAYDLIPPYTRSPVITKLKEIDFMLAGFVRGQLTICIILAALYSLGFVIIGIDLAVVLGTLSGLLFIIPYVGTAVGVVTGSLIALAKFGDWIHPLYVLLWIGLVQLLEAYVLTPRIVGKAIGLHPVVYILALIVGGNLFGFVGMLVAIPVTAVIKVLLNTLIEAYQASYLYEEPVEAGKDSTT
jgi:predicted PurR-regulated permease PerM